MQPRVEVIVGSPSDLPFVWDSVLLNVLELEGIEYAVSACSAHRNAVDLRQRIAAYLGTTGAYVCAAGWAAALPGTVKAHLLGDSSATVFGIALPSEKYPDAQDAEISITRLPLGVDVVYGGIGVDGLNAIAADVCKAAKEYDPTTDADVEYLRQVRGNRKHPQFDIPRPPKEG